MIKEVLRKCQKHERRMKEGRKKRWEGGGEKEGEEGERSNINMKQKRGKTKTQH